MLVVIRQKRRDCICVEVRGVVDDTRNEYPVNYKGICGNITIFRTGDRTTDFTEIQKIKNELGLQDEDFNEEIYLLPEPPEGIGCLVMKKL